MRSYLSLGKLQNLQGQYSSAIVSLQKSIEIATVDFGDNFYLSQAYELLGKAYAYSHNYKDAYAAFAKYDTLKNKIFNAEADQRISLIQTEFDLAQKEDTIELQGIKIRRQGAWQTLITSFLIILLIVLTILYKTFQNNKKKSALLIKQNEEKEFLLKEIHHRVKNNLGIVSSLLELQSEGINDPNVIDMMQKSQNRVHSMSMIHQKLYIGKDLATVEMRDYFINLGNHILDSFGAGDRISLSYPMGQIEIDVDTAVPLGLIVNELLTNALKYAFPNNRKGQIIICLQNNDSNLLLLNVADNGVGQTNMENKGTGFGTKLIELLIQQLDGKMKVENSKGTSVSFEFNIEKSS